MSANYANAGNSVTMLPEVPRIPSADVMFNGVLGELKKLSSHNNIIKEAKDAIFKKNAEVVLIEFKGETSLIHAELIKLREKYGINVYYYFTDHAGVIKKNF